jgi:hypothetical protein
VFEGLYEKAVANVTQSTHEENTTTRDEEDSSNVDAQGEQKKDSPSEPDP